MNGQRFIEVIECMIFNKKLPMILIKSCIDIIYILSLGYCKRTLHRGRYYVLVALHTEPSPVLRKPSSVLPLSQFDEFYSPLCHFGSEFLFINFIVSAWIVTVFLRNKIHKNTSPWMKYTV